ncbi:hypothetical protein SUDANB38_04419 [Streptomyces sp. enrichment culture]
MPWERQVQAWFRADAITSTAKSAGDDQQLWILPDGGKVVSAYAHARCSLVTYQGPQRLLMALAVSLEHRRTDRKVADSTFEHALSTIKAAEPAGPVLVLGKIDTRNKASLAMVGRFGMAHIDTLMDQDGVELGLWAMLID